MSNDLYRFVVNGTQVTAVFENHNGVWRAKSIDATDSFLVNGNTVTWSEAYPNFLEVKVFALQGGDVFVQTSETYLQPNGIPFPLGATFEADAGQPRTEGNRIVVPGDGHDRQLLLQDGGDATAQRRGDVRIGFRAKRFERLH